MKGAAVTIEGRKFTVKTKDQTTHGYFKIDGTKSPKSGWRLIVHKREQK